MMAFGAGGSTGLSFQLSVLGGAVALDVFNGLNTSLKGLAFTASATATAFLVLKRAYNSVIDVALKFSKAAEVQELSLKQLGSALKATGRDAEISVDQIAGVAAELQRFTRFGDEATIAASKWFAQMRDIPSEWIPELMEMSLDLAEVLTSDVHVAFQILARAMEDPRRASRALRRANIMLDTSERDLIKTFDDAGMKLKAMGVIMRAVKDSIGGTAREVADSVAGLRGQIQGLWADVKEKLGDRINNFLMPILEGLKSVLEDINKELEDFNKNITPDEESTGEKQAKSAVQVYKDTIKFRRQMTKEIQEAAIKEVQANTSAAEIGARKLTGMGKGVVDWFTEGYGKYWQLREAQARYIRGSRAIAKLATEELKKLRDEAERERAQEIESAARKRQEKRDEQQAKEILAQQEAQEEAIRLYKQMMRNLASEAERIFESTRTPIEQARRQIDELRKMWDMGIISRDAPGADLFTRRMVQIRKELLDTMTVMDDIKKVEEDRITLGEKIADVSKRITDERERELGFTSSIQSLTGLYARISTAAASRPERNKTLDELKQQRQDLIKQAKIRERQLQELIRLQREREEFVARFG